MPNIIYWHELCDIRLDIGEDTVAALVDLELDLSPTYKVELFIHVQMLVDTIDFDTLERVFRFIKGRDITRITYRTDGYEHEEQIFFKDQKLEIIRSRNYLN